VPTTAEPRPADTLRAIGQRSQQPHLIRDADPARDGAGCAAVYAPFVEDSAASFEERAPSPEGFGERIERMSSTHPWLVAAAGEEVIGFAYACPHRQRAAYRWAADVSVYVAPAHKRRGIGRALYGSLLPLLVRQGLHVACAGITLPNEPSVALHQSFGFTLVGVHRRIGFKQGRWWDVGWWQLELQEPETPAEPSGPARLADA
jgi:phosphinothricin acetyltransferase